jgi:carboxymethylenebutenolidase
MGGPYFDLEAIWDEHTHYEFASRSVEETMATMVEEPYVNHVPTLTGGIGRSKLTNFYRDHFIFSNADDAALELVSRTVGVDRIVDEFLFNCTHDRVIDWLYGRLPLSRVIIARLMLILIVQNPRRPRDAQEAEHPVYEHRQHPRRSPLP